MKHLICCSVALISLTFSAQTSFGVEAVSTATIHKPPNPPQLASTLGATQLLATPRALLPGSASLHKITGVAMVVAAVASILVRTIHDLRDNEAWILGAHFASWQAESTAPHFLSAGDSWSHEAHKGIENALLARLQSIQRKGPESEKMFITELREFEEYLFVNMVAKQQEAQHQDILGHADVQAALRAMEEMQQYLSAARENMEQRQLAYEQSNSLKHWAQMIDRAILNTRISILRKKSSD